MNSLMTNFIQSFFFLKSPSSSFQVLTSSPFLVNANSDFVFSSLF